MMKPDRIFQAAFLLGVAFVFFSGCRDKSPENPGREQPQEGNLKQDSVSIIEPLAGMEEGRALYESHCLVCHQGNGGGVPGLNPPLKDTEYVLGPKPRLLRILIHGSNEGLVVGGRTYSNAMPGFAMLSDEELALLATYIRNSFGNKASLVEASEVTAIRAMDTVEQE